LCGIDIKIVTTKLHLMLPRDAHLSNKFLHRSMANKFYSATTIIFSILCFIKCAKFNEQNEYIIGQLEDSLRVLYGFIKAQNSKRFITKFPSSYCLQIIYLSWSCVYRAFCRYLQLINNKWLINLILNCI
jgi:hypothetical protein